MSHPVLCRARSVFERLGLLGCLAGLFGLCGIWFISSAILLSRIAGRLEGESAPRSLAESSGWLGFGERFIEPALRRSGRLREPSEVLSGKELLRAKLAAEANARSSGVFGAFLLVVCAALLCIRFLDPAQSAEGVGSQVSSPRGASA